MIENLITFILNNQQLDGGFGYYKHANSSVEPTCYSILALNSFDPKLIQIKDSIKCLLSLQNNDGGWLLFKDDNLSSPVATALALITMKNIDPERYSAPLNRGLKYLETVEGFYTTEEMDENAWGWNKGCFIAIDPSAYAVIALKMLNSTDKNRIEQGEKFFIHNTCDAGGWTYGYPVDKNDPESIQVFNNILLPQLHITSLVLLALQGKKLNVSQHINLILREYANSFCPLSLSLAVLALDSYKEENQLVLNHLNKVMTEDDYAKNVLFYNSLAALANLSKKGINPLCLNH